MGGPTATAARRGSQVFALEGAPWYSSWRRSQKTCSGIGRERSPENPEPVSIAHPPGAGALPAQPAGANGLPFTPSVSPVAPSEGGERCKPTGEPSSALREFRELVRRRKRFLIPVTVVWLGIFITYLLLAALAPDVMGNEVARGAPR
jgi:Protein of unknown function, DUF485